MGEGLDESLRRRVETLSEKNEAKDSARDGLGVEDGSEVVRFDVVRSKDFHFHCYVWGFPDVIPVRNSRQNAPRQNPSRTEAHRTGCDHPIIIDLIMIACLL